MRANVNELNKMANQIRQDIIEIAYKAQGPSHPGPALSATDIITALYFQILHIDPQNPKWENRDRFILSKGHACPVLYSALAERGYFPHDWLTTVRRMDSHLQGHPDMKKTPGVDMTSGSLGCGLSTGVGMAYFQKLNNRPSQVFVMLGDGEIQEGPVWEAVMSAPAMRLDNLTAIVDCNHFQSCDSVENIIPEPRIRDIWEGFGWNVLEMNGHNMEDILCTLDMAYHYRGMPTCIIAHTVKGKGVSFMENDNSWHQKTPSKEQYLQAMKELKEDNNYDL